MMAEFDPSTVSTLEVRVEGASDDSPLIAKTTATFTFKFDEGGKKAEEKFFALEWRIASEEGKMPKAIVYLCHGYAEYMSHYYDHVARVLASQGLLVIGHDHVGHGRTTGDRVQAINDFTSDYVSPILTHCKHHTLQNPNVPLFIVAHSMGGTMAVHALLKSQESFKGAVLMGPMIEVDPAIATPINKLMARLLSSVLPGLGVSGVKKEHLSRDKAAVEDATNDPLIWHSGIKLKQAWLSLKALEEIEVRMGEIKTPLLIQHGEADLVTRPEGSKRLHEGVASEDKTLTLYPEAYHSMYMELEEVKEAVIKETCEWIIKRIG